VLRKNGQVADNEDVRLTLDQALLAAQHLIRGYYDRGRSEAVMLLLDYTWADPAAASDWADSVERALAGDDPAAGPFAKPAHP
jgi:hypothetical protein